MNIIEHPKAKSKRVLDLLNSMTLERAPGGEKSKPTSLSYTLIAVVILAAFGSMVPQTSISIFFSILFLVSSGLLGVYSYLQRQSIKKAWIAVALVASMSIMSGCAMPLFGDAVKPLTFIKSDTEIKVGVIQGFGILGLGLTNINIEEAQRQGNIETLVGFEIVRGYGLVSYANVRVYGE